MTAARPVRLIVVGGGAAGLCAALAAREAGAEVLLVAKSPLGMANCTAYAGGGFTAPIEGLSPTEHMRLTREVGRGLSEPRMHEAVSGGAVRALARLREWGVRYDSRRGGLSVSAYGLGGKLGGTGLTLPLRERALAAGVDSLTGVVVTAILRADDGQGRAVGVELYDPEVNEVRREAADGVIVATGGGGASFARSDNPARITGDGYRLLWAAGLELFDMEFVQWYPLGYAEVGFPVWMIGLPIVDHVPLENSEGDRFYERLLQEWGLRGGAQANLFARDRSAVAIGREWHAGREVLLRYDLADQAQLSEIDPLAAGRFKSLGGVRPVRVAPLVHYFCGGVVAAADGMTAVRGLYACGEVVGGFDGANRMGGNALTAVTVLSQLTGDRAALELAQDEGRVTPADAETAVACGSAESLVRRWTANAGISEAPGTAVPAASELRTQIQAALSRGLGIVRTGPGIEASLAELASLRSLISRLAPLTPQERLAAVECLASLAVGSAVGLAALERRESRGAHFREDYPAESEQFRRHVILAPGGVAAEALAEFQAHVRMADVGDVTPHTDFKSI